MALLVSAVGILWIAAPLLLSVAVRLMDFGRYTG